MCNVSTSMCLIMNNICSFLLFFFFKYIELAYYDQAYFPITHGTKPNKYYDKIRYPTAFFHSQFNRFGFWSAMYCNISVCSSFIMTQLCNTLFRLLFIVFLFFILLQFILKIYLKS